MRSIGDIRSKSLASWRLIVLAAAARLEGGGLQGAVADPLPGGPSLDEDNSFDDQYLSAADIHHLLVALDAFINRPEGTWAKVPHEDLVRWAPYRRLRARLQARLGMRMWDDAVGWLDTLLREERNVALGHLRREVEQALTEPSIKRSEIRRRMPVLVDELRCKRLYTPPRHNQVDIEDSRKERKRQQYTSENWRHSPPSAL